MAEKKMTQVEALEFAIEIMDEFAVLDEHIEARDILKHMVDKRKNATRKPRVNEAAERFRDELIDVLRVNGEPMTNAELVIVMNERNKVSGDWGDKEIKPQKVANNIRVLEGRGVVNRIRGEKASDKDTFVLV